MNYRLSILPLAFAFGISGSAPFAQEVGEAAPYVPDTGTETPVTEVTEDTMPGDTNVRGEIVEEKGDVLTMPETSYGLPARMSLPQHGLKMEEVERRYGTPVSREPAVGKPPITRWNYDGFSVFFEHRTVLHAVQQDRPAEIYRKDELLPAVSP